MHKKDIKVLLVNLKILVVSTRFITDFLKEIYIALILIRLVQLVLEGDIHKGITVHKILSLIINSPETTFANPAVFHKLLVVNMHVSQNFNKSFRKIGHILKGINLLCDDFFSIKFVILFVF